MPAESQKLTKAEAGYQFHPDSEYTCGSCVLLKDLKQGKGCAWFGPALQVSESAGGCNYFSHGHPGDQMFDVPWISLFTPVQLGYMENRPGFGCKRCEHHDIFNEDCSKVDRNSAGDTPKSIKAESCCNLWQRDPARGHMSREQLMRWVQDHGNEHGWAKQVKT